MRTPTPSCPRAPGCPTLIRGLALASAALTLHTAAGAPPTVIYSEIPTSPTSLAPDGTGHRITAMLNLWASPDGTNWIFKGFKDDGVSTVIDIIVVGQGNAGSVVATEGQDSDPFPGITYSFFDSSAGINDNGNYVFGARLDDTNGEVIIRGGGPAGQGAVVREGEAATGLEDDPIFNSGDEVFGNSLNSSHITNSELVGFRAANIQNLASDRRTALYEDLFGARTVLFQEQVPNGPLTMDSMPSGKYAHSADGSSYIFEGDTDLTFSSTEVVVVDGAIVLSEGDDVSGNGDIIDAVFDVHMDANGNWAARGDLPGNTDWAVYNGNLVALTGQPIAAGSIENWSDIIATIRTGADGDFVLTGNTDHADADRNSVLTFNACTILLREGDSVDLDGNGIADEGIEINSFSTGDVSIGTDGFLYAFVTLRETDGTTVGDAFIRMTLPCDADLTGTVDPNSPAFGQPDGVTDANDFFFYLGLFSSNELCADLTSTTDPNDPGFGVPDGLLDANDFFFYLNIFVACQ